MSEGAIRAVISDYSIEELRAVLRRLMHKTDADRRCYFFIKSVSLNPFFEVINPEEVVTGHFNRYIAHKRNNGHVVRAVYEYNERIPVIVTVYNPSADRYFEGGGKFADKILP